MRYGLLAAHGHREQLPQWGRTRACVSVDALAHESRESLIGAPRRFGISSALVVSEEVADGYRHS